MTTAKIDVMGYNRIDELRRRVEKDPTSIAFAQLAEEYRRTRDYAQAVKVCREGLARHPGYLSAQVTLGRSLIELGRFDEARIELKAVLAVAPDNLAAIRALANLHHHDDEPLPDFKAIAEAAADQPASQVPEQEAAVPEQEAAVPEQEAALSELEEALADLEEAFPGQESESDRHDPPPVPKEIDPVLRELEYWLTAIVADRAQSR